MTEGIIQQRPDRLQYADDRGWTGGFAGGDLIGPFTSHKTCQLTIIPGGLHLPLRASA